MVTRAGVVEERIPRRAIISLRVKILIGFAIISILAAGSGAIICGLWGVSQGCHEWVDRNGYQLVHNDWWAKTDGCVARTPADDELSHSEEFRNKAIGWVWEFAISAVGTLPGVAIVAISELRFRRNGPDDG